ncbi:hypothetical protein Pmani_006831 [Petrolisthes manimaculis]|uniref:Uncharacterized protein n=1 Tax=Petrolisthes manimaculis TaxID=1843537 RepID=A0AAE1QBY3_9EUCA|nr:hypothetical protein Pmani_006831 [Petrolisthes manimaculis]
MISSYSCLTMKATVSFWIHLKGIASGTMNYGTCWSYQPLGHLEVLWFPGLLKKPCISPYGIAGQTTGAVWKALQNSSQD